MDGGGVTVKPTECVDGGGEEEDWEAMPPSLSGVRLVDSPILLLVYFHKALRADLAELRRLAVEALERGSHTPDFILDLRRRFEFLRLVCKYHCAAEDEVIFLALDVHIKNIVSTYLLEHKSFSDLFCSIFNCLDILSMANEDISSPFQELVLCIGTIRTTICQHMLKEEKQIFPLLMQHLTLEEQNTLVWQFICSVPLILLEDLFPWMISFLSPDEQKDVMHCLLEVVPKEKLLQEVVISWTIGKEQLSFQAYHKYEKGTQFPNMLANFKDMLKVESSKTHYGEERQLKKVFTKHQSVKHNPIDGMLRWHGAIRRDLKEILEELTQLRGSNSFSNSPSVIVHLKFVANIFIFYSNALDKIFYPVLNKISQDRLSLSSGRFLDQSQIEGLQSLLYTKVQSAVSFDTFIEKLYLQLDLFVWEIDKHFNFLETEIFTFISTNCSYDMQQWLLYTCLHMMPLGLLKCMVTWFSGHLSENESKTILYNIKQGVPTANKSFASLLHEWIHIGCSGKTSIEKFRKDLQKMFDGRSSFLSQQICMDSSLSYLQSDKQICNRSNPLQLEQNSTISANNSMPGTAPSCSNTTGKPETLYSSGINLQIFFPQTSEKLFPLPKFSTENSTISTFADGESKPMDHIFFFHKALKKDLAYLVSTSAKLAENDRFLVDFKQRFHLLQSLYKIHSDSEDEFAFPALEAKGKLRNISQSYTIDHKLELELFNRISLILNEISRLHASVSSEEGDTLDQSKQRYHQLCVKLHDLCISVHKILCDHVCREEIELWPLFRECLSIEEQEKIVGHMLGRTRAEILQEMIPWLISYLTPQEQHAMMSLWLNATKNTMFKEWLGEWWEDMKIYDTANVKEESNITSSWAVDPLEVVSTYLLKQCFDDQKTICCKGTETSEKDFDSYKILVAETGSADEKAQTTNRDQDSHKYSDIAGFSSEDNKGYDKIADAIHQTDVASHCINLSPKLGDQEQLLIMSQGELEATIRRVSRDSTLDPQKKSFIIQNLLMSRWVVSQKKSHLDVAKSINSKEEVPGQHPSYREPLESTFGCKHYKRNCKLLAACCNKLYTCIRCHDEMTDHPIERRNITKMMCMKCLIIQPVGPTCSTISCNNLSMARYYCRICKLFDDERVIYHCPYCNLCRLGKGLGIDYFHCMNCNACMSRSLSIHTCRVKCFEDNCPICHEYIFTSSSPVKALPCGHLMHSTCFRDYTCTHYTCPICSKSLGDMQVYFEMLDALLAEEKIPDEYSVKTQVILCNDCERRGTVAFHWLYHKCSYCGSYNTRLV